MLFGGKKKGCLDKVFPADKSLAEVGVEWDVPKIEGVYPTFDPNDHKKTKKGEISYLIVRKTNIKIVKAVGNSLKAQLIESIKECYIQELHQGDYIEYDGRSLLNILTHTKDKYARMNVHILKANLKFFGKEPLMDNLIDNYFAKQEQCQRIAETSKYKITDEKMVAMLVEHMGNTGTLAKSTVKFNKQLDRNKTLAKVKEWFHYVLNDIMEMQKYLGTDQELLANTEAYIKTDAKEEAHNEIVIGMSNSFDMLA